MKLAEATRVTDKRLRPRWRPPLDAAIRHRARDAEPPEGLQELLRKGNRLQEIHLEEMQVGRTGNEILASILERGRAEGLGPRIYTHPIGPYGHGSGTMIRRSSDRELWSELLRPVIEVRRSYVEASFEAVHTEWGGIEVSTGFEEQAVVTAAGGRFVDGYPRSLYLIR